MLLNSLWKSMKETFSDQDDPNSDQTLESFDDMGIQAMSNAVGSAGGLGITELELVPILEEVGRAAVPLPVLESVLVTVQSAVRAPVQGLSWNRVAVT